MRCLIYLDLARKTGDDWTYHQHLVDELPKRLSLLEAEYAGIPWKATFAHETYGDETLESFAQTLRHDRDDYDAVIIVPNVEAVETSGNGYFKRIRDVVTAAGDLPVIAYFDDPGPRAEYNLLTAGVTATVDHTNEPALLPLKIARAVNKGDYSSDIITLGDMSIDMKSGHISVDGQNVGLTVTERSMVLTLARSKGRVRSKEQILKGIYTPGMDEPEIKIIDVFMTKIRSKINDKRPGLGFDVLRTSWGDGYSLLHNMPAGRIHRGLLRLDPHPEGGYTIADTTLTVSDAEFEMLEYLHNALGRGVSEGDNYLVANQDILSALNSTLSSYLVTAGAPILFDPEEARTYLNPEYFDAELFDANKFNSLLRQEVKSIGPYRFIRQNGSHAYRLGESEIVFTVPEVRLLENLMHVEGQAVRAHSLFRQIRGEGHSLRGELTPDEDIIALARGLYAKLQQSGMDERNVHIYHDAYVSFGPAEEIPDPEKISEQRRMELGERMIKRLASASGMEVELVRHDYQIFTMLVHPVMGSAIIEGRGVDLTARQVKAIRTVYDARPDVVSTHVLHDAVYAGRPFNQQKLSTEMYNLRRTLASLDPAWESMLTLMRGKGYVSLLPGETLPEDRPEPELAVDDTWTAEDLGHFTLRVHPATGRAVIDGTGQKISPLQARILQKLHAARIEQGETPDLVSEADLYRACHGSDNFEAGVMSLDINRLRNVLKFHSEDWAAALVTKRGRGYAFLRAGETLPEEAPAAQRSARQRLVAPETPWEEHILVGGLILMQDSISGKSRIEGIDHVWSAGETAMLKLVSARAPETVFLPEIERVAKVTNGALFVNNFRKKWDINAEGAECPVDKGVGGRGLTWTLSPVKASERMAAGPQDDTGQDNEPPQAAFAFAQAVNGICHSAALNAPFTNREAEILTLLETRMGDVLDVMAVAPDSKLSWTPVLVLATLENAQRKIAGINPQLAARLKYSKRDGTMQLGFPPRRLPVARPMSA